MTPTESWLRAVAMADAVTFSILPNQSCRKGHWPCWSVRMRLDITDERGRASRWQGPFDHQSLTDALDVVAVLAASAGGGLEMLNRRDEMVDAGQLVLEIRYDPDAS